ncbi:MAG: OmpA family protein [Sedimentisphaerales bacterium]|nr:OmpA family protein [Sedimentisphaerales bacterium]
MSRRKKGSEEPGPGVPVYIVTYSDMVTLLLTFFVMLLSLAKQQQEDQKFMVGITSFRRAVADFGLSGSLFSKGTGMDFEYPKVQYKVPENEKDSTKEEIDTRSIDEHRNMMRRIVRDIEQMMQTNPSQIKGSDKIACPTTIRFSPGSWQLDPQARTFLDDYSRQMQTSLGEKHTILYIVGLAASEVSPRQQWKVSARRAQEVADYLRTTLPPDISWSIYSWGAGTGGDWAGQTGLVNQNSHILITAVTDQ